MTNTGASTEAKAAVVAEQGAQDAPKAASSTRKATPKKGAPKAKTGAKGAKPKKAAPKRAAVKPKHAEKAAKPAEPRKGTKAAQVIEMMHRANGASLAEIARATDWQNHSIRGFVSGTLVKKLGLKVESFKRENNEHAYRVGQ